MSRSVLLVEDDPESVAGLVGVLRTEGYDVQVAYDGREALARLREGYRPAAIILDLMMPVMDGVAFRHEQEADPELRDIPVVALSGVDHLLRQIRGMGVAAVL